MRKKDINRLTLKAVAKHLDVSTATVSNAFNRPSQLSQELREHILTECRRLGYAGPHAESRQLRTSKTKVIGVMLSNQLSYSFSDPVANQLLQGIAQIFGQAEYNLLVMPSQKAATQLIGIDSFVEGFIVYGPPAADRMDDLLFHRKAIVTIDFEYPGLVSINIDNRKAAFSCAMHALSHKPKHPGILGLRLMDSTWVETIEDKTLYNEFSNITVQRLRGYQDAAVASEIYIPESRIWSIPDNNHVYAYQAAQMALRQTPRPDLLICMSDRVALSTMAAARDMGLRVPEDLMITGFDGIEEAEMSQPSLTTIVQPSVEKGRVAAEIFLGIREEQSLILPESLKVGGSCPHPL